jgi:hypothetical protein
MGTPVLHSAGDDLAGPRCGVRLLLLVSVCQVAMSDVSRHRRVAGGFTTLRSRLFPGTWCAGLSLCPGRAFLLPQAPRKGTAEGDRGRPEGDRRERRRAAGPEPGPAEPGRSERRRPEAGAGRPEPRGTRQARQSRKAATGHFVFLQTGTRNVTTPGPGRSRAEREPPAVMLLRKKGRGARGRAASA